MKKVWAYIISKPLSDTELNQLLNEGKAFVEQWTAHEHQLKASFEIFKKRIILVTVDEAVNNASGCSIDKLMRFIKTTESAFGIELLNRFLVAYKQGEEVEVVHASRIRELITSNAISEDTIVYNTAIATDQELQGWEQSLKNTWLNKYLVKA